MTECTTEIQAIQAARAFLNLFLNLKETNVCMSYNVSYIGVMFCRYTDFTFWLLCFERNGRGMITTLHPGR